MNGPVKTPRSSWEATLGAVTTKLCMVSVCMGIVRALFRMFAAPGARTLSARSSTADTIKVVVALSVMRSSTQKLASSEWKRSPPSPRDAGGGDDDHESWNRSAA